MAAQHNPVVIVGGGPAGLTTAISFARRHPSKAENLLVLERARYPREKICAGAIGRRGERILARFGVHVDVPSVPITGFSITTAAGGGTIVVGDIGRTVRRVEFDQALARKAQELGVRLLEGVTVHAVHVRGDGAVLETSDGEFDAGLVVGADGVGSVVRRSLGETFGRLRAQAVEVDTELVAQDTDRYQAGLLHVDLSDRDFTGYAWDFPSLVDGRPIISRGVYWLQDGGSQDIRGRLDARLRVLGLDAEKYAHKRFAERGLDPPETVGRGPIMLIGEAAGIDSASGEGIAQAIEYGALMGAFLADIHRGRRVPADWPQVLSASTLARNLRIRARLVELFFGAARASLETILVQCPASVEIGARHFGGWPVRWSALLEVAAFAVRHPSVWPFNPVRAQLQQWLR